jgi:hypothetical protein
MLIVIEGPDLGGKTTLAANLARRWHRPTLRSLSRPPAPTVLTVKKGQPVPGVGPFEEYELALDEDKLGEAIRSRHDLVLADRWHTGEGVYGPLLRGRSRLTEAGLTHVELALDALGAVKVACLPPLDVLRDRHTTRGDDLVTADQLELIRGWYDLVTRRYGYEVLNGTEPAHLVPMLLVNRARTRREWAYHAQRLSAGTYLGNPVLPRAILCGDVRNPRGDARFRRPFTPLTAAGSPTWLLNALVFSGYHNDVGLINTAEPGVDLPQLWRALGRPRLVALGRLAEARLTRLDLNHVAVPHPQHAKRFRYHDLDGYVAQLKEAIHPWSSTTAVAHTSTSTSFETLSTTARWSAPAASEPGSSAT